MGTSIPMSTTNAPVLIPEPEQIYGEMPCQTQCINCHQLITTRTDSRMRTEGWVLCWCCCLLFSFFSLLVFCLPGLRQFYHYCPLCGALLGISRPSLSRCEITLLFILVLIMKITAVGFLYYFLYARN